jgi:hypothetical protein
MARRWALAALVLAGAVPAGAGGGYPRLDFEYSDVWTSVCAELTKEEIPRPLERAAQALVPEMAREWEANAPALLGTTVELVGARFQATELHAVLSVCRTPSMSHPLVINVRRYVSRLDRPPDKALIVGAVFHEVLHWYVNPLVPRDSRLIEKYRGQPELVLRHLHLLALQKQVYLKLGRGEELARIVEADGALPNPAYRRAWQIVNEVEGSAPFVAELK